ncbi:polysaccharide biosynthesis tyrosine autokinase [Maribacter sp. PR1]|uniref:non-specific protein-tyrosine kinase n=1 Tax=Maribacter cobaltidurans TaxID=1178778 RepID=A0ABU7IVZ6_9FLAO|nr:MULTISPECIES: polysaccharide biosynthesis tyrosine autokinase [Maribacter]MDC6389777.1 polysaccharide biosynthesis tyrosine autokinase [Maribacter sp. PR1]MEE1977167.1 polysaccharide biosynthesis tyrosine autokinase [Maribacter cobaltidurans]
MNSDFNNISERNFDYRQMLYPYTKRWKLFVVFVIITILLGLLFVRYSVPLYELQAKIQIIEDESGSSQLDVFQDLDVFGGVGNQIEDEMEILTSRSNLVNLVKKLGLNVEIIALGNIKDSEIYGSQNLPFKVNFIAADSLIYNSMVDFYINLNDENTYEYAESSDGPYKLHSYGKTISSPVGDIIITPNVKNTGGVNYKKYMVSISPVSLVAEQYQKEIQVTVADEKSKIISILLQDAIPARGQDIINTLIADYNQNAIDDKKALADRTSNFIDDRIASISSNLSSADQSAVEFKSDRGIADIATQNSLNLSIGAENQEQLQNASIQLDIASSMKDIIENEDGYELLPSNIGLQDASIASATERYNELALERKRLLESSNEKNPTIVNLDQQLDGLKRSMRSSLSSMTNNLGLQVNSLSSRLSKINSRIYSAPKNEQALRDIGRKQETTESLYLYLLQRREEAQIAFASSSPKSKIVDNAYLVSKYPVFPKKSIVLAAAFLLGMLLPFSYIYVIDLLDNKVHNKLSLEKLVGSTPVLAELPKISKKDNILIRQGERTVMAESLRILRANLDYILKSKKNLGTNGNIIFVTSSVSGEGKTLVSSNLAMIFANTNKKVLLIGADIRNPKLYQFYSGKNVDKLGKSSRSSRDKGLTEYLVDNTLKSENIISTMLAYEQTIDVIYSGKIPPNPAEILMNGRMKELFDEIKGIYDYIIVDTAPLLVVADTLLISEFAHQTLYVTRAGMTELKVLNYPLKLSNEGKLKGLSFVVNGVKDSNLGYGGKYGYGYAKTTKKWWRI